jgi:pimeloyl-[acyl-carrier protein] methyl ester esterase
MGASAFSADGSKTGMKLRFVHGWGFDASFWARIIDEMPGWHADCDERGYFGKACTPAASGPFIFVTHSFGAMRALGGSHAQCRGLLAINGFDRFTPGVPPRVVERMIAKFDENPGAVIQDFRGRHGIAAPFGTPIGERLRADLVALREMDRTDESAAWPTPILSMQGAGDSLLPASLRDDAFAGARNVERMTHPEGGHVLPITHAAYCAQAIATFADRVA